MLTDVHSREYLDGLAGLWNVNVGHGREELAESAAAQMKELAYFSTYVGSSNIPAIDLADRLIRLAYKNMVAVFFTCGGAESNESAFKTARFYWKTNGKTSKVKVIALREAYHGVTLQAMSATGWSRTSSPSPRCRPRTAGCTPTPTLATPWRPLRLCGSPRGIPTQPR